MPVVLRTEAPRQQLAGARCFDNVGRAVAPQLRALGIERDEEMQPLAGIGVGRGKERGIGNVEIRLIQRYLRGVLREYPFESVALGRLPVFAVDGLVLP